MLSPTGDPSPGRPSASARASMALLGHSGMLECCHPDNSLYPKVSLVDEYYVQVVSCHEVLEFLDFAL